MGNAELALADANDNPRLKECVTEIRKAGLRAREVVRQILSFSRRQPTERKLASLEPVIRECARLLRAALPANISMDVNCSSNVPPVLADETQIQQVLLNLAGNAMQAMRGRPGRIVFRLDAVAINADMVKSHPQLHPLFDQRSGPAVRIAVSDDGVGMDAATLEKIFEPFFTTKPRGEGTGLGLSVVHGIVQTHEGAILVDSAVGAGTTFSIYLPAARAVDNAPALVAPTAPVAPEAPSVEPSGYKKHLLYLDDDESLVFLVRRVLERNGYRVSGFTSQQEALDAFRAAPASFDVAVLDHNMPGMSGLDVAREIKQIRNDIPVAVASGVVDEDLQAQAESAGVCELISKAFDLKELCAAFERLAQARTAPPTPSREIP